MYMEKPKKVGLVNKSLKLFKKFLRGFGWTMQAHSNDNKLLELIHTHF